jgi:hypothetical protein
MTVRTVLANTTRFILCAVPGAAIILVLFPVLILAGLVPPWARGIEVAAAIAMVPVGAALILYGTNNWGRWGYTLPIVAVVPWFLSWHAHTVVQLALLILPFAVAWGVRKYYRNRTAVQPGQAAEPRSIP